MLTEYCAYTHKGVDTEDRLVGKKKESVGEEREQERVMGESEQNALSALYM